MWTVDIDTVDVILDVNNNDWAEVDEPLILVVDGIDWLILVFDKVDDEAIFECVKVDKGLVDELIAVVLSSKPAVLVTPELGGLLLSLVIDDVLVVIEDDTVDEIGNDDDKDDKDIFDWFAVVDGCELVDVTIVGFNDVNVLATGDDVELCVTIVFEIAVEVITVDVTKVAEIVIFADDDVTEFDSVALDVSSKFKNKISIDIVISHPSHRHCY
jgi:hypothetical protein